MYGGLRGLMGWEKRWVSLAILGREDGSLTLTIKWQMWSKTSFSTTSGEGGGWRGPLAVLQMSPKLGFGLLLCIESISDGIFVHFSTLSSFLPYWYLGKQTQYGKHMRHRQNDTVLIGSFYYCTILLHEINFCELNKICISNIGSYRFFLKYFSRLKTDHECEMGWLICKFCLAHRNLSLLFVGYV